MEVVVGRVGRPHGVRGEVRVDPRTDEVDRRFTPGAVLRPEPAQTELAQPERLTVRSWRRHGEWLLVRFAEVAGRGEATGLAGATLYADVSADEQPEEPDEYYDRQLVGLQVRTPDGNPVGDVIDVIHLPEQEVLVIRQVTGAEALVPFVQELVPSVDLDDATLVVVDQPGLLDEDERT